MSKNLSSELPGQGYRGFRRNWRNDLIAAFSVALVALPLALGIALAAGAPPMSGIISAVIGGVVTTFIRGSHVAINGPGNGLIAVILAAMGLMADGSGNTFSYVLAAVVVSGGIQVLLGVFRLGKYAELFPSSVIHGILAAIGVIIFAKQVHIAIRGAAPGGNTIEILQQIPESIANINPFIAIISILSLLLLIFHSKISYKLFHIIPAPLMVLVMAIPFAFWFNFFEPHSLSLFGNDYAVGPSQLIQLPPNILDSILFPNFSRIGDGAFWLAVLSITLIGSIETLASAKAVDKLDAYKRETDLNKELAGVGFSSMVSGMIGGLPIMTVIVRSSVNVNNNAKTRWSNLYHSLFLLMFILLLAPIIQMVPLAALAGILVFTGYKLASPHVFKLAYDQGVEQLLFLVGTTIITLYTNLIWGLIGGMVLTLIIHILLARIPVSEFFRMIFNSKTEVHELGEDHYRIEVKGIANFLSMLHLRKLLATVPIGKQVEVDLSEARLVDLTVLELFQDFGRKTKDAGGSYIIKGAENHVASTDHPLALKSQITKFKQRLNPREQRLKYLAEAKGWNYTRTVDWDTSYLQEFRFFESRPIEYKENSIRGKYAEQNVSWEIADITFDEGALLATEVYHTTVQILHVPCEMPKFVMEREGLVDKVFDRVMAFSGQRDLDFKLFPQFSKRFLLKAENESVIREFFGKDLMKFFENEEIYHIECNGEALLIFKYLRLARTEEISKMLEFSNALLEKINPKVV